MRQGDAFLISAKPSFSERRTLWATGPLDIYSGGPEEFSWQRLRHLSARGFLVGYLSYDLAEHLIGLAGAGLPGPSFWFGLYETILVKDEISGAWWRWFPDGSRRKCSRPDTPEPGPFALGFRGFDQSRDRYMARIAEIKRDIAEGHYYQLNYTTRARFNFEGDPGGLMFRLIKEQPIPYAALLDTGEKIIVSASPELFLRVRSKTALSKPMKGTLKTETGSWRRLRGSAKDRAENLMIADLVRHDLGKVAKRVRVQGLFRVERYSTVFQMVSVIEADLLPDKDLWDVVASCFPPGSVTGAPKSSATEAIARLEATPRGIYTGILGYSLPWGEGVFSVAIRTCEIKGSELIYGTGGGITFASEPVKEWRECEAKMAVLRALGPNL